MTTTSDPVSQAADTLPPAARELLEQARRQVLDEGRGLSQEQILQCLTLRPLQNRSPRWPTGAIDSVLHRSLHS